MNHNYKRFLNGQPWAILHSELDAATLKAVSSDAEALDLSGLIQAPQVQYIGKAAVVTINGTIVKSRTLADILFDETVTTHEIQSQLVEALSSPAKAVILNISSPGGQVSGMKSLTNFIYETRQNSDKPIIAFGSGVVASGAFWISSQCDATIIEDGTTCGSLGVITLTFDYTEHLAKEGIRGYAHKSGLIKGAGGEIGGHSVEQVRSIEAQVMRHFEIFRSDVQRGRNLTDAQIAALSDAHVSIGQDAVNDGMADEVGTLEAILRDYL